MNGLVVSFNILTLTGGWRPESWSTPNKKILYYVYMIVTAVILHTYSISQVLDLVLIVDNSEDFAENIYMTLPMLMASCKHLIIGTHRKTIDDLVKILLTPPCKPFDEGEKEIQDKCDKASLWNAKAYIYVIQVSIVCNLLSTFITDIAKRQLPYRVWLPYDYNNSISLYALAYFQQIGGGLISAFTQVAADILICGFILQICGQIEILEYRLECISKGSELSLSACVYHHDFIYRFSEMVNETFMVIILCQFVSSTFLACFSLYQMSEEPFSAFYIQHLIYLLVVLAQIFYYCYFGNKLKFKSIQIINTISGMDWPSLDKDTKHGLLMMMRRAMTPIEFVCAYVIGMNLESFVNLVKTSYSVYNLLEQTREK